MKCVFLQLLLILCTVQLHSANSKDIIIHTDKYSYARGEVVQLRLAGAEELIGNTYAVELLNSNSLPLTHISIEMENGSGNGQILIPENITNNDIYQIIAYPKDDRENFTTKTILVNDNFEITTQDAPLLLRERIYLQTDKQIYLAGELLWIKLFTTDASCKPTNLSKVGYVEILDGNTPIAQVAVELNNGVGEGCLLLPSTIPTGNYRIVAYTKYMQNKGEDIFFSKPIPIINTFSTEQAVEYTTSKVSKNIAEPTIESSVFVTADSDSYNTRSNGIVHINNIPDSIHTISLSISGIDCVGALRQSATIGFWKSTVTSQSHKSVPLRIIPEYEGHIITAQLERNIEQPNQTISAMLSLPGNDIRLYNGKIDDTNNTITFYTRRIPNVQEVALSFLPESDTKFEATIHSPFYSKHSAHIQPTLQLDQAWRDALLERSVGLQLLHAYNGDSLFIKKNDGSEFPWEYSERYMLDDYTRFKTMREVVSEFIPALRFRTQNGKRLLNIIKEDGSAYSNGNSLVLLDGILISDHEHIYNYDPLLVKEVAIYRGQYAFGEQVFDGIVAFKTHDGDYKGLKTSQNTQIFSYKSSSGKRNFYIPSYQTVDEKNSSIPDYRHTLLWAPNVNAAGKSSISIPFTTSDIKGRFKVTVEGITKNGTVVTGTTTITVE